LFFDQPRRQSGDLMGTQPERANLHYHWNWRQQVNELQTIAEARSILAEDFLKQVRQVDAATMTDEQRDKLLDQVFLAMSWIELGERVDDLAFVIRHKMRQEEEAIDKDRKRKTHGRRAA